MGELLAGRHAVVTGAGDIGRVIVRELVLNGATVVAWDTDETLFADGFGLGRDEQSRVKSATVDVTSVQSVEKAAAEAVEELGRVDILVNSAAVLGPVASVQETSRDQWNRVLDINLSGVFTCCSALLPALVEAGSGSIVNVSSVGGLSGEANIAAYCASKFGVIGFSESLAGEVGPLGVRVNCVCPGAIDSRMNSSLLDAFAAGQGRDSQDLLDDLLASTPLRRLITAEEVARAVAFLASDFSQGITGQSLRVDGGLSG